MKVTLRDLPDTAMGDEHYAINRVVHTRTSCTVHLLTHPSGREVDIEFKGVVGLKVLDERDLTRFWRVNLDPSGASFTGLVKQVLSGGWLEEEEIRSSHIPTGFYGEVAEYLVSSDYECVNVLCTEYPVVRVISTSESQNQDR